jgi:hypothetical protein
MVAVFREIEFISDFTFQFNRKYKAVSTDAERRHMLPDSAPTPQL